MNCTKGTIDVSNFSKPMPIIGLYIAGATFLCIVQMVRDLVIGFKSKQIWIPAKHFSIDAVLLTVMGVAIKLSVDLNSPMPSHIDQLAKLATSAFICTVLVNTRPSLGKLEKGELLANTIALAILIITSIVNICIQLTTGVIQAFRIVHIILIVSMFYLLLNSITMAAYLPAMKKYLQLKFEKLHQQSLQESLFSVSSGNKKESMKIKEYLMKFSMLAQSSCPNFVSSRSVPFLAEILYGLMPATLALFFVLIATIAHKDKMAGLNTCSGQSDYGWSVLVILITQVIAVVIGSVAPLSRTIYVYRSMIAILKGTNAILKGTNPPPEESHEEEKFWYRYLEWTLEYPVFLHIEDRQRSHFVYLLKDTVTRILLRSHFTLTGTMDLIMRIWPYTLPTPRRSNQKPNDLRPYFVHLKMEETYVNSMVETSSRVIQKYLDTEKRKPKHLIEFLKDYLSHDFGGVFSFESDGVPPLSSSDGTPPNCWALPVLTLTCIATALPNIDQNSKESLRKSLIEALVYVKLVEDQLNDGRDLINIRAAANLVWLSLDRHCSWSALDLECLARRCVRPLSAVLVLSQLANKVFSKNVNDQETDKVSLSLKVDKLRRALAADSMYRVCQTILQEFQNESNLDPSSEEIFKKLCITIADILGACFTNLRQCILQKCKRSTLEKRRETAFSMLRVFSKTERIMEILEEEGRKIPDLSDDKRAFIDEWRSYPTCHRTEEQSRTESNDRTEEQSRTQGDGLYVV